MKDYGLGELQSVLKEILCDIDAFCKKNNITYWLAYGSVLGAVRHSDFIPWDDDCDIAIAQEDYKRFYELASVQLADKYSVEYPFDGEEGRISPLIKVKKKGTTLVNKMYLLTEDRGVHRVFIDVFPLFNIPNGSLSRKKQRNVEIIYNLIQRNERANSKAVNMAIDVLVKLFSRKRMLKWLFNSFSKYKAEKCDCMECITSTREYGAERMRREVYYPPAYLPFGKLTVPVPNDTDCYLRAFYGDDYMVLPSEEKRMEAQHGLFIDLKKDYTEYGEVIEEEKQKLLSGV